MEGDCHRGLFGGGRPASGDQVDGCFRKLELLAAKARKSNAGGGGSQSDMELSNALRGVCAVESPTLSSDGRLVASQDGSGHSIPLTMMAEESMCLAVGAPLSGPSVVPVLGATSLSYPWVADAPAVARVVPESAKEDVRSVELGAASMAGSALGAGCGAVAELDVGLSCMSHVEAEREFACQLGVASICSAQVQEAGTGCEGVFLASSYLSSKGDNVDPAHSPGRAAGSASQPLTPAVAASQLINEQRVDEGFQARLAFPIISSAGAHAAMDVGVGVVGPTSTLPFSPPVSGIFCAGSGSQVLPFSSGPLCCYPK